MPSVMTENLDVLETMALNCTAWACESRDDELHLFLIDAPDFAVDVDMRFLAELGTPSHLELTFGTCGGSFCEG